MSTLMYVACTAQSYAPTALTWRTIQTYKDSVLSEDRKEHHRGDAQGSHDYAGPDPGYNHRDDRYREHEEPPGPLKAGPGQSHGAHAIDGKQHRPGSRGEAEAAPEGQHDERRVAQNHGEGEPVGGNVDRVFVDDDPDRRQPDKRSNDQGPVQRAAPPLNQRHFALPAASENPSAFISAPFHVRRPGRPRSLPVPPERTSEPQGRNNLSHQIALRRSRQVSGISMGSG